MLSFASHLIGHASTDRSALRTLTVCVVDPHAGDYQDWRNVAEANGLRLEIVANAEEALRFSRKQCVDLWVVNTALPGRSGCELCSMLKAQSARALVYLVSDQYTTEVERSAFAARATLFGCKGEHAGWLEAWLQTERPRRDHGSGPTSKFRI